MVFDRLRRPYVTVSLIATMTLIHLSLGGLMMARRGAGPLLALAGERPTRLLVRAGAMRGARVDLGELWRLISCIFLHGDGLHLLLNMLALWALGRLCEALYGPQRFLGLFLLSGLCGASFSWLGGNLNSVGASGGIFGLLGAGFIFGWRYRERLPEPMSVFLRRRLAPWIAINLLIGFLIPFIDNLGHIGGLVGGSILAMTMGNAIIPGEQSPRWLQVMGTLGSLSLLAYALWGVWS